MTANSASAIAGACVCESGQTYSLCCGRFLDKGEIALTAAILMRSRYTAYVLQREDYLLATWHQTTRPQSLSLTKAEDDPTRWLGLSIRRSVTNGDRAIVEFVARFRIGSKRAERLHEVSRFVRENGHWFYVDGEMK